MKSICLPFLFFLILIEALFAQVPDSIVIRTERSISDSHPMVFSRMEVDSFALGKKIGGSVWSWENNIWNLVSRYHNDFDVQGRLSVTSQFSFSQNFWVPFSEKTYTYNSNDSVVMIITDLQGTISRIIYNYTGSTLSQKISEIFNNGAWENTFLTNYNYDVNGNRILVEDNLWKGSFWVPTYFVESEYAMGNQWYTDTSYSISTQKYYQEYQLHMRDLANRDTSIYKHLYNPINPDPWSNGSRYVNTYDWLGRFLIEKGETPLGDFSANYQSGTAYSYDSISHRTNFLDLTPDLYVNTGYIQYMTDGITPLVEMNDADGPGYSYTGYKEYYYFTTVSNQVILPQSIRKCSADSIVMPAIYNPLNTFTAFSWVPDSGLSSDTAQYPIIGTTTNQLYTLIAVDINGLVDTFEIMVYVDATNLDSIVVDYIDTTLACQSVGLTVNPSNQSYQWELNGIIFSTQESISVDTNGTFILTTTNFNGCLNRDSITINYLAPSIRPIITSTCDGMLSTTYSSALYLWYGYSYLDDDFSSPYFLGTTTVDSFNLTTTQLQNFSSFYVRCTDVNGCARKSDRIFFRKEANPLSDVWANCPGGCDAQIRFYYNRDYGYSYFPYSFHFSTGDSCLVSAPNFIYNIDSLCIGPLIYTIDNSIGCIVTDTIIVNPPSTPNYISIIKTNVSSIDSCDGQVKIVPVNFIPGNLTYSCIDDTNCVYFSSDSGYTFVNVCYGAHSVQSYLGSCAENSSLFIDTLQCGIMHSTESTTCIGCSNGVINFQSTGTPPFLVTMMPIAGTIYNDSIAGLGPGIFTVCVTDSFGCNNCFTDTIFEDPTWINKWELKNASIYPNPSSGELIITITSNSSNEDFTLILLSPSGKIVRSETIVNGVNKLNISDLLNGVYLLRIENGLEILRTKLIVMK